MEEPSNLEIKEVEEAEWNTDSVVYSSVSLWYHKK